MSYKTTFAACAVLLAVSGCATGGRHSYVALSLDSRSGSTVTGLLRFSDKRGRLHLRGTVRGLAPGSEHGFHIHEKGDCSAADASSAGGHFNPAASAHGRFGDATHHGGDLPSLKANAKGIASIDVELPGLTLGDGANGIKGRSVIVHGKADDFTTQPTGNSGPRVACGVI